MEKQEIKRLFTIAMAIVSLGAFVLAACGGEGETEPGTFMATATLAVAAKPTATGQTVQLVPTPTRSLATPESHLRPCILVNSGHVSGTVTHAGTPVPDGTFVNLLFEGGPSQNTLTKDGHYSLPMLARECSDGLHWVEFSLWAGGKGQTVHPDRADYHLDLETPQLPTSVRPDRPARELVLGTVSGIVSIGGEIAPDGTVVSARIGSGGESLAQTVLTTDGRYTLTSVGTRWSNEPVKFLQMTLSALGTDITIIPTQESTIQDIAVPLCTLIYGGHISGTVTHAGTPVPNSTFVALIFAGGPVLNTPTKDGRYSLPLLARECSDGLHWIRFGLRTSGRGGAGVHPDRADYYLDLEAPETPIQAPPDTPACDELVLGTVSGVVSIDGEIAPDGTVVSARIGPGGESHAQTVLTTNGRYTLASVGVRCDNGAVEFFQMSLSALPLSSLGTSVTITPTQENTIQDITVPR